MKEKYKKQYSNLRSKIEMKELHYTDLIDLIIKAREQRDNYKKNLSELNKELITLKEKNLRLYKCHKKLLNGLGDLNK